MRVVLDTNVLISALLWKGHLARLFVLVNQHKITLYFTPATLRELFRVVSYPRINVQARRMNVDLTFILTWVIEAGVVVKSIPIPKTIWDDPSDDEFLSCAVAARADFIISGDTHLLRLRVFRDIPILSPKQFLDRIDKQQH